ncbi:MAG: CDP-glycerol--poly(glycerophosphate) glycerophosphotransferase [Desulfovibrio sp.]|nr:MAG: CDP-glycerol--poly(glycerophosphate) glycerophosphotransferase [Desulfovibrio sp.]
MSQSPMDNTGINPTQVSFEEAGLDMATVARFVSAHNRKPGHVAFIGRADSQFAGNTKYLFLHVLEQEPELNATFVTLNQEVYSLLRDKGLPVAMYPETDALTALAEASCVVVNDFHYRTQLMHLFTNGAFVLQLWHGVGFKKIGFVEAETSEHMTPEKRDYLRDMYSGYDAVISTSPFYSRNLFATSFGAGEIWETGYPRNDVLLRQPSKLEFLGSDPKLCGRMRHIRTERRIGLYAPTFRDDGGDPFIHGVLDMDRLESFLAANAMTLFIKMHQFCNTYTLDESPYIQILPNSLDIYPMLSQVDFMITDYSSIYTDYLLLDRPVLFFPYDREDYAQRLREFQFDYDEMTPGPKCFSQESLQQALLEVAQGRDLHRVERRAALKRAFGHASPRSCAKVAAKLKLAALGQVHSPMGRAATG